MRVLLVALLFVVGCSGSEPAALPLDTQASYAQLRADVDALQARLDGLRVPGDTSAELAAIRAEVEGLKASMAKIAAPVKVPHYVDTDTGEDIGAIVTDATVWREDLRAELAPFSTPYVYFAEAGCKGAAVLRGAVTSRRRALVVSPWGTLLRITGSVLGFRHLSTQGEDGSCEETAGGIAASTFDDTGTKYNFRDPSRVSVELR